MTQRLLVLFNCLNFVDDTNNNFMTTIDIRAIEISLVKKKTQKVFALFFLLEMSWQQ
jgi:hypothetical protein